ncbi:MAG: DEAD/DEAH box helicase [Chloroflexi bacterium]|nr:DEAD/DEAH box helicase [Chloroflexota bacterium]
MDVFHLRKQLIDDYAAYASSFIEIRDPLIREVVHTNIREGVFWPEPLIQLNPAFQSGGTISDLVQQGILHAECDRIFRRGKERGENLPLRLHQHQLDAIRTAQAQKHYILTTGTGSGKSLAYIIPIVDHILKNGSGRGIQAIIVYPMNALANSQEGELRKFLVDGYPPDSSPVTFARYTGQENEQARQRIITHPPDILLTNYVMLELLMTRPHERRLIESARGLRFFVLDELHTYRGRQGADVALLVRRVRERLESGRPMQCVGTSATLASEGTYAEQRQRIAEVAAQLFGAEVDAQQVIGETLRRATPERDEQHAPFVDDLTQAVALGRDLVAPTAFDEFVRHPLSSWIESVFGVHIKDGRLTRTTPQSIHGDGGAAERLQHVTGVDRATCAEVIERWLLAGYHCEPDPTTGFRPFAFRLHQFISPGDAVYATLEPEAVRYLTLRGQQFVPHDRDRILVPLCFCRECGQEYYTVRLTTDDTHKVLPRDFGDQQEDDTSEAGYLYVSTHRPWSNDLQAIKERLPEDWLEDFKDTQRVKSSRRDKLPRVIAIRHNGEQGSEGQLCAYIPAPFNFCLNCGVTYAPRQSEFGKLALLSSEGRSSATTILSLSAVRSLKTSDLSPQARKLLSFTDNRQDASLQAGHFNDFIEVALLRGAIYQAAVEAGEAGLRHDEIAQRVFTALNLPLELYASDAQVRFQALQETQKALRQVLGYRIYRDLRRGWRVTSPNLEQCGLLDIEYESLAEVCASDDVWAHAHPALASAHAATRERVAKVLLDYMRRELAIKVDYLNPSYQERIQQQSSQRLIEPWAIDEDELMERATILFPRPRSGDDTLEHRYLSARGGYGLYLRRVNTFPGYDAKAYGRIDTTSTDLIIRQLLEGLQVAGIVEVVVEPKDKTDVPGYQVVAGAMRWCAGDGSLPFHDPIRVPTESTAGGRVNPFFIDFYQSVASTLIGYEAREHTAQVPPAERIEREDKFRAAELPILYCSPTMELGVDIAELNVVNLRNVPPTPANYAQRSGRAGRSGQPALVFTYCSGGSPHDQYFFRRPDRMVVGAVAPPRLDLTNTDLLRAHIHALWLAETGLDLGRSLKDVLDMAGETPSLALLPEKRAQAEALAARQQARQRAQRILNTIHDLPNPDDLLDAALNAAVQAFDGALERWRGLYRSALQQADVQNKVIRDASRSAHDKKQAERLRREAEAQLKLLTEIENYEQSDFYSYRYFATEGFLPGYSFPRLPISAFIPGRRTRQRDEFLSRPRFLAVSEFGPRAIIYHEGSRYLINQVIMPVSAHEDGEPLTTQIKQCPACGYIHPDPHLDLCERCGRPLETAFTRLLRMQNVVTRRRDRINSDEEERFRLGYEIRTGVRYADKDGRESAQSARVLVDGQEVIQLTYAPAATLWRINLGWTRRKNKREYGFVLDLERGYWARNEQVEDDPADPLSARTQRVIPYVEDNRNCLLFEPLVELELEDLASLQAALKRAIETRYQLEDNELAAEPLPDAYDRRLILFYESTEGGAGVLRQLIDDPRALNSLARDALALCHFDPETGVDQRRARNAHEDCEAACYDCLLSYANQRDHRLLDRQRLRPLLLSLAEAHVITSPTTATRESHLDQLLKLCDSELEQDWLRYLDGRGYRLPDSAQVLFQDCGTRPDFVYSETYAVVYVDGSPHDYVHRRERDRQQASCMEDVGFSVIRFGYRDDWDKILRQYAHVFGNGS